MFLAAKAGTSATIPEVAAKLGLSRNHTMRIAAKLAATGLIASTRGRSGGLALGKEAHSITVEEIVRAIEPDFALVPCLQEPSKQNCSIEPACLLKGALSAALSAFFAELRAATLADLTASNQVSLAVIFRLNDPAHPIKFRARERSSIKRLAQVGGAR